MYIHAHPAFAESRTNCGNASHEGSKVGPVGTKDGTHSARKPTLSGEVQIVRGWRDKGM